MGYRIFVKRDRFKFSCAHMTVFPDGTKERLHGHNYYVSLALDLTDVRLENMVDFGPIKDALAELCAEWKERTLIARLCPYLEMISESPEEVEFRLCGKRYVLPAEDILMLPIDNAAVEPLSAYAADWLLARLGNAVPPEKVQAIEVTIEENPGQGGTTRRLLARAD